MVDKVISVTGLSKKYPASSGFALENINLCINRGDFYALLGPNGAGKTTLVSILNGLLPYDSGTVSICGFDISSSSDKNKIKYLSGMVPQDLAIYERLSVGENLGFFARLYGLGGKLLRERVGEVLEVAALLEHQNKKVATLSGGMKRRLNLAASLINRPQILFLDEPAVGVDIQSRKLIHNRLQSLSAQGTTIIYTTHYMEEVVELCNRVGIIDRGKLKVEGKLVDLLQNSDCSTLSELFLKLTGSELRDE